MQFSQSTPKDLTELFLRAELKDEQEVVSRLAIVIHSNASMSNTCVTKHVINNGVMGLAQIVSIEDLEQTVSQFANEHELKGNADYSAFMDSNIIAKSSTVLAWQTLRQSKKLYIKDKCFNVAIPPLLFVFRPAKNKGTSSLSVFALAANKRPTLQTKLYHAPLMNIYDDGRLCLGTMQIPKTINPNTIELVESEFFRSKFSHPNHDNLTRKKVSIELFYSQKEKSGEKIMTSELMPMKRTLAQVI